MQTHGYSAEFGRAAGGIVSVVTKSGTNRFAGSAFEFHRDSALDARGYFDPEDPPDFLRNQFGAVAGRPGACGTGCSSSAATKACAIETS